MPGRDNFEFLTKAPVNKVIVRMAIPTIIGMLVTSLYNIVDTFYVGRISTQATAAVGVAFPVMALIQAFGFFFGQGSGTYISRQLGARKTDDAKQMASTAFVSSFAFGLAIAIIGLLFLEPLSLALGSTPTILPHTRDYLGIVLLGAPFVTSAMTLNNQLRFQGNASNAMLGIVAGAVLNVALVPIFTFTLGLGLKGTAIGTVLGEVSSFALLLYMTGKKGSIKLSVRDIIFTGHFFEEIVKGGTPSLSRQGLASVSTLMLNVAAVAYGDAAVAGMSIVTRISFVVFSIIIGIGQGFQPLCGFCYGAGLFDRVREGFFFCFKSSLAFLLLVCIPGFILAYDVVYLLRPDADVALIGASALKWQVITYPLASFITVTNMTLQTSGRTVPANIIASSRNGIFFIPLILILPSFLGIKGVEMCQAVADVFSFAVAAILMYNYFKSLNISGLSKDRP